MRAESSTPNCRCNAIQDLREDEDEAYFGSYSHFSIHRDMLQVSNVTYKYVMASKCIKTESFTYIFFFKYKF